MNLAKFGVNTDQLSQINHAVWELISVQEALADDKVGEHGNETERTWDRKTLEMWDLSCVIFRQQGNSGIKTSKASNTTWYKIGQNEGIQGCTHTHYERKGKEKVRN